MNKTININLGGFFFHIDETAYQKLKRYLDAIARSLSDDPQGKDEIIADIEARISELLTERITHERQVVNEADIDEIIAIMGQPEAYAETEDTYSEDTSHQRRKTTVNKKMFRDVDDRFFAGVCSGLGHYFNIDVIWIRLTFLILTLAGFGSGVIAYVILWILLPEARTTSEKLQMEGEAVNIDNIEKKIRDEFDNISSKLKEGAHDLSDKISNTDYDKIRKQSQSGLQDFISTIGKILQTIFKVFGKFMGVLLLIISGITIVSLLLGLFSLGSLEILNFDSDIQYPPFFYDSVIPKWLLMTSLFFLIGIPFVVLFILGLRILSPNLKRISTATILTLFGLWLVSLLTIGFSGIEYATSHAYDGTKITKHNITYNQENPLKIRVKNNDDIFYLHNLRNRNNSEQVTINGTEMKYSNDVNIDVRKSETGTAYVEIKKTSSGKKRLNANNNAEAIVYEFKNQNNTLVFDAFFISEFKNMHKDEEIDAIIYIPEETTVYFEGSSRNFLNNIRNNQDVYGRDMANHHFKMTSKGFDCIDCDEENNNEELNQDINNTTKNKDTIIDKQ